MIQLATLFALFAQVPASFDGSMVYDLTNGPVPYNQPPNNEISRLTAKLQFEPRHGYLLSVLKSLNIPLSSQTLVFSKTSFQAPQIFPHAPRAIYFNDDTYIGWVKGADYLEVSTADPTLGAVFYVLEQEPKARPRFERHDDCLQCHHSARTSGVPGHIVRSVYTQPNGQIHTNTSSYITDQRSPMEERWGGWYVSGKIDFPHLGNQLFPEIDTGRKVKSFDSPAWPAQTSDVVAHLVLAHQATGHNYLARLNYETRAALHLQKIMNEMDRKPDVEASWSESTRRRITSAIEATVRYLTYADEAPLPAPIQGDSTFAQDFQKQHPLKKLNLKTRVFEYPLSYLIESKALTALEPIIRAKLDQRLAQVLLEEAGSEQFRNLDPQRAREAWRIHQNATPEIDLHGHHWVNTIGHCAGILVFATLFLLIYRDSHRSGHRLKLLPLASTLLALGWDLGLLIGIATRDQSAFWANASAALAFACLSLLPAVLLDLGLGAHLRPLRIAGYALGGFCALLHVSEVFIQGPDIHGFALAVLSIGFAIFAVAAFALLRNQQSRISPAASLCLFLLSISFLHFRAQAGTHALWSEIILHHAGIPIALFVVLQDYRFLLLDAFLRLAASGLLAGAFVAALWQGRHAIVRLTESDDPFLFGMLLVAASLILLAFAKSREAIQRWLTSRVFLRHDPEQVTQGLQSLEGDEPAMLESAARILAGYFRAERWSLSSTNSETADASSRITFLKGDHIFLHLSGRRFLSEDVEALDLFSAVIAREVDRARTRELERLMIQAELRALQAQIHPHFLFNALNALYGSIPRQAADARRLVLSLSEVFRYFLTTSKSTVRLEEELTIIEAYLEIEKARLGPRLTTNIEIPAALQQLFIPVLSVEPLVENAIKHGIAAQPGPGALTLRARLDANMLVIEVHDTGPGPGHHNPKESNRVGLDNVRRRLKLHYGDLASLDVAAVPGGTLAQIRVPAQGQEAAAQGAEVAAGGIVVGE